MNLHANARTCPNSRELLARRVIEEGWSRARAANAAGVSTRTAAKWVARYRAGEPMGDRSSAPRRVPSRTPRQTIDAIEALRRLRMTAAEIAEALRMAISTVSRWLKRIGLGKRSRLEPPEPPNRYERARPGELVHVDVKQLGRIEGGAGKRVTGGIKRNPDRRRLDAAGRERKTIGWEYVHVAIDDHSRLAYAEVLPDQKATTAIAFLSRAVAFYRRYGIEVERLLTDNGSAYVSALHALACRRLGVRHLRTRPFRPQTNGKAERFIRTLVAGWAYGAIYRSSRERTDALDGWLWYYNHRRRHAALGHQPPVSRTNLLGSYT
jgi:transposase InsO family protein